MRPVCTNPLSYTPLALWPEIISIKGNRHAAARRRRGQSALARHLFHRRSEGRKVRLCSRQPRRPRRDLRLSAALRRDHRAVRRGHSRGAHRAQFPFERPHARRPHALCLRRRLELAGHRRVRVLPIRGAPGRLTNEP